MRALGLLAIFVIINWTSAADDSVTVQVSSTVVSNAIPSDFSSFSYEVSGALAMTGRSPSPPKASFVQLLQNLRFTPNSRGPNLRIGGNSADESWWDPQDNPKPPHITYDIKPIDLVSVNNVAKAVNGTIVFDLNFRQPSTPEWALNHVKGIIGNVGWDHVSGLEIGNECDLYKRNGIRNDSYTFSDYESEWYMYAQAIYAAGAPKPRIQGATFCCLVSEFDKGLPGYMRKYKDLLASISYHRYPTEHCNGHVVTLAELMSDHATTSQGILMKPFAQVAQSLSLPFYIAEANSVACGGMPGVSNVFGSALWAVDFMFTMASINAGRVNFHGGSRSTYTAIGYNSSESDVPDVRPLYYAMWLFARVTSNNARVLAVQLDSTNSYVKAWASKSTNGEINVVLIHKDITTSNYASVSISFEESVAGTAQLARLRSQDGPTGYYGINFASQTFDGSKDGRPVGNRATETVQKTDGKFSFSLNPASIAVLTIKNN